MRTKIYISICVLTFALLAGSHAFASEVSGILWVGDAPADQTTATTTGHSSEISGTVGTNLATSSEISGTLASNSGAPTVTYTPAYVTINNTLGATVTGGISEEELARLALVNFGPRYSGSPGAPETGGVESGGDYSNLNLDVTDGESDPQDLSFSSGFPSPGQGPVSASDLTAAALPGSSGLSTAQLLFIVLVALAVLGSIGYALAQRGKANA